MRVGERGLYVYMCHVYISEWNGDMNGYDSPGISKRASNTSTFLQIFVASDTALNAGQLRRLGPPVDKGSRPKVHCLVECGEKSFWWFLDASARKLDLIHYWYMKNHEKSLAALKLLTVRWLLGPWRPPSWGLQVRHCDGAVLCHNAMFLGSYWPCGIVLV